MGSKSDYSTMKLCEKTLKLLKVNYETNIVSAHRTPERMFNYAKSAESETLMLLLQAQEDLHIYLADCCINKNTSNRRSY